MPTNYRVFLGNWSALGTLRPGIARRHLALNYIFSGALFAFQFDFDVLLASLTVWVNNANCLAIHLHQKPPFSMIDASSGTDRTINVNLHSVGRLLSNSGGPSWNRTKTKPLWGARPTIGPMVQIYPFRGMLRVWSGFPRAWQHYYFSSASSNGWPLLSSNRCPTELPGAMFTNEFHFFWAVSLKAHGTRPILLSLCELPLCLLALALRCLSLLLFSTSLSNRKNFSVYPNILWAVPRGVNRYCMPLMPLWAVQTGLSSCSHPIP